MSRIVISHWLRNVSLNPDFYIRFEIQQTEIMRLVIFKSIRKTSL